MIDFLANIRAVIYRNALWAYRSPFRLIDIVLWPIVALFTLTFFLSSTGGAEQFTGLLVLSIIGWRAIFFVTFETTAIFIEEHWDDSLPNLLVCPINPKELALGGALTGMLKAIVVVFLCLAVGSVAYGFTLTQPFQFILALFCLMLAGLSIGFVLFGLACCFEKRNIFSLSFMIPELVALFSGPYYDVNKVFPSWLAAISNTFPTTHAFNVIKSIFGMAEADYTMLVATSLVWLVAAIVINDILYQKGRKKGTLVKFG